MFLTVSVNDRKTTVKGEYCKQMVSLTDWWGVRMKWTGWIGCKENQSLPIVCHLKLLHIHYTSFIVIFCCYARYPCVPLNAYSKCVALCCSTACCCDFEFKTIFMFFNVKIKRELFADRKEWNCTGVLLWTNTPWHFIKS